MKTVSQVNMIELRYTCCPYCKNILIQAHTVVNGYIICAKCNKTVHIEIQNGKVITNIEKE